MTPHGSGKRPLTDFSVYTIEVICTVGGMAERDGGAALFRGRPVVRHSTCPGLQALDWFACNFGLITGDFGLYVSRTAGNVVLRLQFWTGAFGVPARVPVHASSTIQVSR